MNNHYDIIIAGGGAAGLYAAIFAGRRGRRVLVLDHAEKVGKKILISGGGRCNFTNLETKPDRYLSANPHFAISALKRHTQHDFITLVDRHGIGWHEKKLGQLFCDDGAGRILSMLLDECADAGVAIRTECRIDEVTPVDGGGFNVVTSHGTFTSQSFILATGGPSIPKMGATDFAFRLARKWGLNVVEPRPALVPLTFAPGDLDKLKDLSGVPLEATVSCGKGRFREALLITHRGLSGPSILQISSYWQPGQGVRIDLSPDQTLADHLKGLKRTRHKAELKTILGELLPRRFAERLFEVALTGPAPLVNRPMADIKDADLLAVANALHGWTVHPDGTEGYRTAEVTAGGVDTAELSSKTMEAKKIPGLYIVGEAVDVTGWLGGYNFQWAWSSGHAAGMAA